MKSHYFRWYWAQQVFENFIAERYATELIRTPGKWPAYPFLCLLHRRETNGSLPVTGLMYAPLQNDFAVLSPATLDDMPQFGGDMTEEEFMSRLRFYESMEHVLKDWRIDLPIDD